MSDTDWIKLDLHIHTLDDPKDALDYSAHQLLERAREFGFRVLAITLHDAVFDRPEVSRMPPAWGSDHPGRRGSAGGRRCYFAQRPASEIESLRSLNDLQALRIRRGQSFYDCAASVLRPRRFHGRKARAENRLFRRDRALSFLDPLFQSKSPRDASRGALQETADRDLRRSSAPRLWIELHEHPTPGGADD